jgi:hypothetical protein
MSGNYSRLTGDGILARMPRAAVVTVIAALLPMLALAACSHAAAPAPAPTPPSVTLTYCGVNHQVRPDVLLVVGYTNDITARDLTWTAWGRPTATATGTATVDVCAYDDCHTGAYTNVPIRLIASKIVGCAGSKRAYSTLRYVFPEGNPWPGIPANLNTSSYIAGPERVLPPKNQTVSLTC